METATGNPGFPSMHVKIASAAVARTFAIKIVQGIQQAIVNCALPAMTSSFAKDGIIC